MSLQAIQQEMEQEAKIDKTIDIFVKRFLKQNRKYYKVPKREQSDVILVFYRTDVSKYGIVLNKDSNNFIDEYERDDSVTLIYLKNKNPHDAKRTTYGDVKGIIPSAKMKKKIIL